MGSPAQLLSQLQPPQSIIFFFRGCKDESVKETSSQTLMLHHFLLWIPPEPQMNWQQLRKTSATAVTLSALTHILNSKQCQVVWEIFTSYNAFAVSNLSGHSFHNLEANTYSLFQGSLKNYAPLFLRPFITSHRVRFKNYGKGVLESQETNNNNNNNKKVDLAYVSKQNWCKNGCLQ